MAISDELPHIAFVDTDALWAWLRLHYASDAGRWVVLQRAGSRTPSVTFHDLLEAGIAFGWSESTRRGRDATSYLQKFTPRRSVGTTSERNRAIAERLQSEGRLTEPGRRALGWPPDDGTQD